MTPLKDARDKLLISIIDPVIDKIIKSSWWIRVASLIIVASIIGILQYPNEVRGWFSFGERLVRVVVAPANTLPLSSSSRDRLDRLLSTLSVNLNADILNKSQGEEFGYTPWPIAQIAVALNGVGEIKSKDLEKFWLESLDTKCKCWRETRFKEPHLPASSWVLYAFAALDLPHINGPEQYLLGNQKLRGWWPVHPSSFQEKNASTYATAWALLAIYAHWQRGHYAGDAEVKVHEAIMKGVAWLQKTKIKNRARWQDYPYGSNGMESISISGLALHLFHMVFPNEKLVEIDSQWLNELPTKLSSASEVEMTDSYIQLESGVLDFDKTRHYKLPWAIIATVDSYANNSAFQKMRAIEWLERILRGELADGSVLVHNWIAAELLMSLHYLKERTQA